MQVILSWIKMQKNDLWWHLLLMALVCNLEHQPKKNDGGTMPIFLCEVVSHNIGATVSDVWL